MDNGDKSEFANVWRATLDFYGKRATTEAFRLSFAALAGYTIEQVRAGISRHMADTEIGQWAPKPADVIRGIEGRTDDRAAIAWAQVREALHRVGAYATVVFDDSRIHCAIRGCGGWVAMCHGKDDALPFLERDFVRQYRAAIATNMPHPKSLPGIEARDNPRDVPPVLIGEPERAAEVFLSGTDTPGAVVTLAGPLAAKLLERAS